MSIEKEQQEAILKLMGMLDNAYKAIAPFLGFKEFYINPRQKAWAKSQKQADTLQLGESIYKFVRDEIEDETTKEKL